MTRIIHIMYPTVILETGETLYVTDFDNTPRVGMYARKQGKRYIAVSYADGDCST